MQISFNARYLDVDGNWVLYHNVMSCYKKLSNKIDIEPFEGIIQYLGYCHIRTGIQTYWQDTKRELIYTMSTDHSLHALSKAKAGLLSGTFTIKSRGGYVSLYLVEKNNNE